MASSFFEQIREGLTAFDRDGHEVGTVTKVVREPPEGMSGYGYVEVQRSLPGRSIDVHLPLTAVLEVHPDRLVVELDPDLVAAENQQIKPEKYPG